MLLFTGTSLVATADADLLAVFKESSAPFLSVHEIPTALVLASPECLKEERERRLFFSTEKRIVPVRLERPFTFFMKELLFLLHSQTRLLEQATIFEFVVFYFCG
eukprot:1018294_1